MFGFSWHKKSRRKGKAKRKRQPARQPQPQRRPDVGEVYVMLRKAKDALDMIPDIDLAKAKSAMNTVEDLLWQAVNSR